MDFRKLLLLIIVSITISSLSYFAFNRFILKNGAGSAALSVNSASGSLTVALNGEVVGKTPYYSDTLKEGEAALTLTSESSSYRTNVKLTARALTVMSYSLGPSDDFSEGETIWLERSKDAGSLVVISDPDGSEVRLDETLLGTTPLSIKKIAVGDHTLKVGKSGYRSRSIKIQNQPGYSLNVKARTFLLPIAVGAGSLTFADDPRYKISDFSTTSPSLYADTSAWAKGVNFYLSSPDRDPAVTNGAFDIFLDYRGQIFDKDGAKNSNPTLSTKESIKVAYLGKSVENGLSDDAKTALKSLSDKILPKVNQVQILPTGTGWLRVHKTPSTLLTDVITKVNEGDKLNLISEDESYFRVSLPDGQEGYISKRFASKL